jgi:hypothetical protein
MVSEKEIQKEMREHPWASRDLARRIAEDHAKRKTTTKEGKRLYMRDYMRDKRQDKAQAIPTISQALGLNLPKRKRR